MSLSILGIGTATPPRQIAQADAATLAIDFANAEAGRERTLAAIYRQTRIRTRGSVLLEEPGDAAYAQTFFPPATHGDDAGPTTAERMARYAHEAGPLAIAAARSALREAGRPAAAITHIVTCSCTGFANPGVDLEVVAALGLPGTVARTHVGFMGCHGAFNALRVAHAFAAADPAAIVLVVCVELCSLHFQYGTRSDHVVANSIFADGAAAIVATAQNSETRSRSQLLGQRSQVLPKSTDQMGWIIGDHGFEMTLSPRVPDAIAMHLPAGVDALLQGHGLTRSDVRSWAVHPGGPRILTAVAEALGLAEPALHCSRGVLADHGNMSSATILFILERLAQEARPGPCMAMAFGPGLTAELALLTL
jgi:predicted naringenin-chalcone synthase